MNHPFDAYKGARVFITGHTGFKGTWLSEWLAGLGAEVTGYSLEPPTNPNMYEALGTSRRIRDLRGDIRDRGSLVNALADVQPSVVFHLAAQPIVRASYVDPCETFATNVMGTVNVLDAVRAVPSVRACVVVTSDKCYENREVTSGYRESDAMGGFDPYSASKGCAELVSASYRRSFFHPETFGDTHNVALASGRSGNVIGGGDWGADRIVPDCVRALAKGEPIVLRSPQAVRPWQHVLEPLSGYLLLGSRLIEHGPVFATGWNFGPSDARLFTVEDIVKEAVSVWGGGRYEVNDAKQPHEAGLLRLDISQATYYLGWRPLYDPIRAVQESVGWYKAFYDSVGAAALLDRTLREIDRYTAAQDFVAPRIPVGTRTLSI